MDTISRVYQNSRNSLVRKLRNSYHLRQEESEDLISDAFLIALSREPFLRLDFADNSVRTYVSTVGSREAARGKKKAKRENNNIFSDYSLTVPSVEEKIIKAEIAAERQQHFVAAFDRLSDLQKQVLLANFKGTSLLSLAEELDFNYSYIRRVKSQAVARLRDLLVSAQ